MRSFSFGLGFCDADFAGQTIAVDALFESDVSLFTPPSSPRVADNPETIAEADDGDAVIEGAASALGLNSAVVGLPAVGGIHGDREGSVLLKERGELAFTCRCSENSTESCDGGRGLGGAASAGDSAAGGVWVGAFTVDSTVRDNPTDGRGHISSLAPVSGGLGALNEFLLGEGEKGMASQLEGTFHCRDCGEGPAAAALCLVLDGVDDASGAPVEIRDLVLLQLLGGVGRRTRNRQVPSEDAVVVHALELIFAQIRELVDPVRSGCVQLVQAVNVVQGLGKALQGVSLHRGSRVLTVVRELEVAERKCDFFQWASDSQSSKEE